MAKNHTLEGKTRASIAPLTVQKMKLIDSVGGLTVTFGIYYLILNSKGNLESSADSLLREYRRSRAKQYDPFLMACLSTINCKCYYRSCLIIDLC